MNLAQWLHTSALVSPAAPALFHGTTMQANYGQFASQASALGAWLQSAHGVAAGDRVALYMPNRTEFLVALYAIWWAGAVAVPINYKLHPTEAAWIADNAQVSLVFTDNGNSFSAGVLPAGSTELGIDTHVNRALATMQKHVPTTPVQLDDGALAWLFYTSGTTGRPKGVMLTHGNLSAMALCYPMDVDQVSAEDACVYAAPMSHGAGLYNLIFVRAGARHVVPQSRGFDSQEILDLAAQLREATMFAAPTMLKRLVTVARDQGATGDGIKTVVLGGGPLYAADLVDALDLFGPRFAQIYGQGESPMTITAMPARVIAQRDHPNWRHRLASVGTPHSCIEVRIADDMLNSVPAGTCGEVLARGPAVMAGYWRNPQATAETLVDGWLRTGDIGYLSDDGFLTLTDRSKDVIITGGSNVYPREVEEVMLRHPDVFEVAVVGAPNPEWGEEVVAFVVTHADQAVTPEQLEHWCRNSMASFKKPRRYVFLSELPKNSYGKVLKTELRKQLSQLD